MQTEQIDQLWERATGGGELSQEEAIALLSDPSMDHAFLYDTGADAIARAFGMKRAPCYVAHDTRDQPKGLTLADTPPGGRARGCGAHDLALAIAQHLGCAPDYVPMGRGSQWRVCAAAVSAYLAKRAGA